MQPWQECETDDQTHRFVQWAIFTMMTFDYISFLFSYIPVNPAWI